MQPPRDFIVSKEQPLTKLLDWFRFKEHLIKEYAAHLIEQYKSFSCEPLFYQTLSFHKTYQAPISPIIDSDGEVFPTINVGWDCSSAGYVAEDQVFARQFRVSLGFIGFSRQQHGRCGDIQRSISTFPVMPPSTY